MSTSPFNISFRRALVENKLVAWHDYLTDSGAYIHDWIVWRLEIPLNFDFYAMVSSSPTVT